METPKNRPLVSILIPCYNAGKWLEAAIESALGQTWEPKEVIVVDDGSQDGSREVLARYGDRIRWEGYPNRGPNTTRNRLLEMARGEWVQYLDADDYLLPDKIKSQLKAIEDERALIANARETIPQVDVVYSPVAVEQWIDNEATPHVESAVDLSKDIFCQWFSWQLPQTGGALWRKETILAAGSWREAPPGEVPCCEHDLYARALRNGSHFLFSPKADAVYRIWSETTLCRQSPVKIIETKNGLFDVMIAWLKEQGIWNESHRQAAGEACFRMARSWATHDLKAASLYYRQRRSEGLIEASGVAAPPMYRLLIHTLGFGWAERIASWRRRSSLAISNEA